MICIKAEIPKELSDIDDELKAICHSKDTVCFYIFRSDRKSTRLNSSHSQQSRMPSSA